MTLALKIMGGLTKSKTGAIGGQNRPWFNKILKQNNFYLAQTVINTQCMTSKNNYLNIFGKIGKI